MITTTSPAGPDRGLPGGARDFSLFLGGPLFQLFRRVRLTDDALGLVRQRIIVISLIAWLPLLLISGVERHLFGSGDEVPFLKDVGIHVRFLVALPLLIVAELLVHQRMRPLVAQFVDRGLVPEGARKRFDDSIASALRLRNSVVAELVILAIVYGVGILVVWRQYSSLDTATWYATPSSAGSRLSFAGMWLTYVSLPFFQFILIRWYFRLAIWARFLWHVSRIDLSLMPPHPDRVGGLGFLSNTVYAFIPVLLAHGAILAGHIADRIFFAGATLLDFKLEIVGLVAFFMCVLLGPLLLFAPQLSQAKLMGLCRYGALVDRYTREFDAKWLNSNAAPDERLLGSADIQALADWGTSFGIVESMRIAPLTKETVIQLAAMTLVPLAPLVLTMMPLEELLKRLFTILL